MTSPSSRPESHHDAKLSLSNTSFEWGRRTYVMAILNITPDSFSGDGLAGKREASIDAAARAIADGADILDVGGESTRPGADLVSVDEELHRVVPVIAEIRRRFDVVVSVDTSKSAVAAAALGAGAHMVNDVWGMQADPDMASTVAERDVPVVIMHNRSRPSTAEYQEGLGGHYVNVEYDDVMRDVCRDLRESVGRALDAGVAHRNIVLDPGIGFGKTAAQNLELIDRLLELRTLGFPVLVGPSRKSFIGLTLSSPPEDRLEGTAAAVAIAIARGADIVRVHDVREMVRVVTMSDAIVRR